MGWCGEDESKINLDRMIPPSHFFSHFLLLLPYFKLVFGHKLIDIKVEKNEGENV